MDMEYKDTSHRKRRLLILVGLATAVLAAYAAYWMGSQPVAAQPEPVPMRSVVVAVQALPARTVIQPGDVVMREVPDDPTLAEALTSLDDALGHVTSVPIMPGQAVYPNLLVGTAVEGQLTIVPAHEVITEDSPYWRAVSVSVPRDRAVGGRILSGQRVDLFATVQIDIMTVDDSGNYVTEPSSDGFQSGRSTKITFQDMEVLEAAPEESLYILKVDLATAEEIYHIAAVAPNSFSIALRPDGDIRTAETEEFGQTNDRVITHYLFPIPRILTIGDGTFVGPGIPVDPNDLPPPPPPANEEPEPEPDEPEEPEEPEAAGPGS